MWVSRHPMNNSLAVFIHGIWGSRWTTWRSYVDFFQRLPTEHADLRSYDIYLFTYDTPRFGAQPPLRETIVPRLRAFLGAERAHYDTVALVGHSQGGILAKLYIIDELLAERGAELAVDLIITINTPHRGADWRNPLVLAGLLVSSLLNRMWGLRRLWLMRQLADLSPWSANIRLLATHWDSCLSVQPGTVTPTCRYVRSIAICALRDWMVSIRSAEGFYADEKNATFDRHAVDSAEFVGSFLAHHDDPASRRRELTACHATPELAAAHRGAWAARAAAIIDSLGVWPPHYAQQRAWCFAHEFRPAFTKRPLRRLPLTQAFERYVRKVLDTCAP
jgi:pimeloyl-ACP methyl ester carboxylesterase